MPGSPSRVHRQALTKLETQREEISSHLEPVLDALSNLAENNSDYKDGDDENGDALLAPPEEEADVAARALALLVSLFSLSFVIVRGRAPDSHSSGSVCHLRRRRPWCAVKRLLRFGAFALAIDSKDSCSC